MGSSKCTLRKEIRNEISKYIDSEFIVELTKEIVNYIDSEKKVIIDDSSYDKWNVESKVTINEAGSFNIQDYMYVREFLYEISKEGNYVEDTEEGGFRYIPSDIASILYSKVEESMELKKGQLYKEFKKRYTEEYLFNAVRWYKRSRDGKVYHDIDLNEIDDKKKRSLEEKIKTEVGNGFKSRWGSSVATKVQPIEKRLLLEVYNEGCKLLGKTNEHKLESVSEKNDIDENSLAVVMIKNCKEASRSTKGINRLKVKVVNAIDKNLDSLISFNIYNTEDHMRLFLNNAREIVFGYYKTVNLKGFKENLLTKEDKIIKIIRRMAVVENILYKNYLKNNKKAPSIEELIDFKDCIPWICTKGLIWTAENVYIKNIVKDEIQDVIVNNPIEEYEEARNMKRHFYLHIGETNTGKTYSSIERLMDADTGVYLAPLRLLALEIQDKLNSNNIPCSLLTGEEEDIINYSSHISSTIEKLQLGNKYDVCVIDEAQMIADKQRGWAWTRAIIGVLSEEIHICMAPEAKNIVIKLIKDCNDTYEIIEHKRDTQLIFEDKKFDLNKDVKKGDALVVFGKRKALAVSAQLLTNNVKTSIIYGSLPYSTRKKQFERFLDGETDVIVCTDAIGMGVNLPIKRIVFLESRKYDGVNFRKIIPSEIKQIAGRAGRKGIYDEGYVTAASDRDLIKSGLKAVGKPIDKCYIAIPDSLLDLDIDIIDALKTWSMAPIKGYFQKPDVTTIIFLLNRLKALKLNVSKADMLKMATIPFEENNKTVQKLWEEYCIMYSQGALNLTKPKLNKIVNTKKELDELETYYKSLELNYSFGKNFNMIINNKYISMEKENTANKINNLLLTSLLDHERVCIDCGKKLSWDHASERCRICKEKNMFLKGDKYKYNFRESKKRSDFRGRGSRRRYF